MRKSAAGKSEAAEIIRRSKISEFLSPSLRKKALHLFWAIVLGISYSFAYFGTLYNNHLLFWLSFLLFISLSFPSFLLLQGYIAEPFARKETWFFALSILLEALWLYLLACTASSLLGKKRDK